MRKTLYSAGLAITLLLLGAAPGLAQVIDNFQTPGQPPSGTDYLVVSTGSDRFVQTGVDAIGGTRVYYGQKFSGDSAVFLGISNLQRFRFSEDPVTQGRAKLLYGYSQVNVASLDANNYTAGHTLANLNLNTTGTNGLTMSYVGSFAASLTVSLISGSEGTPQVATVTLPAIGATTVFFPKAAFTINNPALNFNDIDQVIVSMDGLPASVNATLDNIAFTLTTVPEPAALALGGLGFVGLGGIVYRKVKHKRRRREMAKLAKLAKPQLA